MELPAAAVEPNEAQPAATAVVPNNAPAELVPAAAEPDTAPGDLPIAAVEPNEAQPAVPGVVPNKMPLHLPPHLGQIRRRPNYRPERLSRLRPHRAPRQELCSEGQISRTDEATEPDDQARDPDYHADSAICAAPVCGADGRTLRLALESSSGASRARGGGPCSAFPERLEALHLPLAAGGAAGREPTTLAALAAVLACLRDNESLCEYIGGHEEFVDARRDTCRRRREVCGASLAR